MIISKIELFENAQSNDDDVDNNTFKALDSITIALKEGEGIIIGKARGDFESYNTYFCPTYSCQLANNFFFHNDKFSKNFFHAVHMQSISLQ